MMYDTTFNPNQQAGVTPQNNNYGVQLAKALMAGQQRQGGGQPQGMQPGQGMERLGGDLSNLFGKLFGGGNGAAGG